MIAMRTLGLAHLVIAAALAGGPAGAQTLAGVQAEPATLKPGENATVTVQFDVPSGMNCGVRVHWGDGSSTDYKINQAKDVPLVVQHAWAQPGRFTVKAEPKSQGLTPKCGGRNQETVVTVSAPAATVAATVAAAAASAPRASSSVAPRPNAAVARTSPCPAPWALNKPGVGKNGAFTCSAKPDTPLPAPRVSCPGDLTYFENVKRGQFGCRT